MSLDYTYEYPVKAVFFNSAVRYWGNWRVTRGGAYIRFMCGCQWSERDTPKFCSTHERDKEERK